MKGNPRLGVPFTGISKIVGVGLNYRDHAKEAGMPIPSEPILFMKATTCISGPSDPLVLPPGSVKTDWEVELGIVIGTVARHVPVERALDHIAGYCVANDVSEREYTSSNAARSWDKGKGCDTFGPLGPCSSPRRNPRPAGPAPLAGTQRRACRTATSSNMVFAAPSWSATSAAS